MSITLQDAIQRAELMVEGEPGLQQDSYNMLIRSLDREDVYPFTMALVERDISVRTSSVNDKAVEAMRKIVSENEEEELPLTESLSDKMARIAQTFVQKDDGLWVPSEYSESEEAPPYGAQSFEEEETELVEEDIEEQWTIEEYEGLQDTEALRQELENAGIHIDEAGNVSFYKSLTNLPYLPGVYTEKGKMKPMPLEKAFKLFDQSMGSTDKEQTRVNELLDFLSRLTSEVYDMEYTMDEISKFKYSPTSKNPEIQNIANGLGEVQALVADGDWDGAQGALAGLKGTLEDYTQAQQQKYTNSLSIVETLDRLMDIKEHEPEKFNQITKDLGMTSLIPEETPKAAQMVDKSDTHVGKIVIDIGKDFIKDCINRKMTDFPNATSDSVYDELVKEVVNDGIIDLEYFEGLVEDIISTEDVPEAKIELKVVNGSGIDGSRIIYQTGKPGPSVGIMEEYTEEWDEEELNEPDMIEKIICEEIEDFAEIVAETINEDGR